MKPTLEQRFMTPRILWAALCFATVLLAILPYVAQLPDQTPPAIMLPMLGGLAFVQVILSIVFPESVLRKAFAKQLPKFVVERANPAAEVTFREAAPPIKVFDDLDATWTKVLMMWQPPFIMKMALAESIALLGLVLPFQGFPRITALPFAIVALILQLARFPTLGKIQSAVEKATGVPLPLPGG